MINIYYNINDETVYSYAMNMLKEINEYNKFDHVVTEFLNTLSDNDFDKDSIIELSNMYNTIIKDYSCKDFNESVSIYNDMLTSYRRKFNRDFCILNGIPEMVQPLIDENLVAEKIKKATELYNQYIEKQSSNFTRLLDNVSKYKKSNRVSCMDSIYVEDFFLEKSNISAFNVLIVYTEENSNIEKEDFYFFDDYDEMINSLKTAELIIENDDEFTLYPFELVNDNIAIGIYYRDEEDVRIL